MRDSVSCEGPGEGPGFMRGGPGEGPGFMRGGPGEGLGFMREGPGFHVHVWGSRVHV